MVLLGGLFRPRAVRDVLFALDRLCRTPLANNPLFDPMLVRARKVVMGAPNAIREQVVLEGEQPLQIALNVLINLAARDLSSGEDHIYRGRLSMTGTRKLALFHAAQDMMVERGLVTQRDSGEGRALLAEQIRDAG